MGTGLADSSLGELEHQRPFVEVFLWLLYFYGRKSALSLQVEDQLVSLGLLISVLYNG